MRPTLFNDGVECLRRKERENTTASRHIQRTLMLPYLTYMYILPTYMYLTVRTHFHVPGHPA